MSKTKNRNLRWQSAGIVGEEKITLTLKIGSVYHVRNITCIHLRVNGPNIYIYIYRRRKIYKELPRKIQ
jgi:hypothetical protein